MKWRVSEGGKTKSKHGQEMERPREDGVYESEEARVAVLNGAIKGGGFYMFKES